MLNNIVRNCAILRNSRFISNIGLISHHASKQFRTKTTYVVLLPEEAEHIEEPIKTDNGLPNFDDLSADKLYSLIGRQSLNYESSIWSLEEKLKDGNLSFEDIFEKLDNLDAQLSLPGGLVNILYTVNKDDITIKNYLKIITRARKAKIHKFQSQPIYKACTELSSNSSLDANKKRVIKRFLLEGKLHGINLSSKLKQELDHLLSKIKQTKDNYQINLQNASNKFSYRILDPNIVKDFPEGLLKNMSRSSFDLKHGPWNATHHPLVYPGFLEYCPDKELRWNAWQAYISRCFLELNSQYNNSIHVEEIRDYRNRQASLLGYKNFGEMSMETKMAKSPEDVFEFISKLNHKAKYLQEEELASLSDFASQNGHVGQLGESDIAYWRMKHRESQVSLDVNEVKKFFAFEKVWSELLLLCSRLFGLQFEEVEVNESNKWHPDVRFFRVLDADGYFLSSFYLDPFQRPSSKLQSMADSNWMIMMDSNSVLANTKPSSTLIFNFDSPTEGVTLLSLQDVETLFKKFGQSLQHLCATFPYGQASGLVNVEWDATEICPNFLLHWLYNPEVLKSLSRHVETREQFSDQQIQDLRLSRRHMIGFDICQELFKAEFDMRIHTSKSFWMDIMKEVWPKHNAFPFDKDNTFPCWFHPIMSDVWAASYYSHLWAKSVAADLYSAFDEAKSEQEIQALGKRFRETFLNIGGGRHSGELFHSFRGRDPDHEALFSVYSE